MVTVSEGRLAPKRLVANLSRVLVVVLLLAVLAYIQLPWPTFPSTLVSLQSVGVFLAAILLGPLWGTAAVLLLVVVGAVGIPVLHGGSGVEFLLSTPKGGYLLAYIPATILIGYLVHNGLKLRTPSEISVKRLLIAILSGIALLLAAVTIWYAMLKDTGIVTAMLIAPMTYLWVEMLKIVLVVGVVRADLLVPK